MGRRSVGVPNRLPRVRAAARRRTARREQRTSSTPVSATAPTITRSVTRNSCWCWPAPRPGATPKGATCWQSGTWSCSPKGRDSARQLINKSTAITRLLVPSTMPAPYGCAYPDAASARPWAAFRPERPGRAAGVARCVPQPASDRDAHRSAVSETVSAGGAGAEPGRARDAALSAASDPRGKRRCVRRRPIAPAPGRTGVALRPTVALGGRPLGATRQCLEQLRPHREDHHP